MDEDRRNLINIYSHCLLDTNAQINSLLITQRTIITQLNNLNSAMNSSYRRPRDFNRYPRQTTTDSSRNSIYSNEITTASIINTARSFYDRVQVVPSHSQIQRACRNIPFSSIINPLNLSCPINLEQFNENSDVTQIIHCGHIFNPDSLNLWFQSNVRCPVCRYDIRDYNEVVPNHNSEDIPDTDTERVTTTRSNNRTLVNNSELTDVLSNLTETILNQILPSGTHLIDSSHNSIYYDPTGTGTIVFESLLRR
jgi:Ring finger domain